MQLDVAVELAKNEIITNINEVSGRYKLPSFLLNNIIQLIANETSRIAQEDLTKNMEDYKRQKNMETYKKVSKKKESDK